ncbi:EVE domain-containing protein [Bacillus sp. V3]|nr:EVE domain-containing protein [Bacillus sp. V3]
MVTPITINKNSKVIYEASSIQDAASFLVDQVNMNITKCFDTIERGYVYDIPYYEEENEFRFIAAVERAAQRRKELEDNNHKNARRVWLVPANPNEYDIENAFNRYETLDWKRSYNYENGDILFLYVSGKVRRVRFKVEVIDGLIQTDNNLYDPEFWFDDEKLAKSKDWDWSRVRLVDEVNDEGLSLEHLRTHGLKGNIQGSMKITGDLRDYIMKFFNQDLTADLYAEEVPETLEEGKRKTISVNVYERNPLARKKCLGHHGYKCQVCGIDFEAVYGEVGRDFIHVHHIMALKEIGEEYEVNPTQDLIPVCPNCHAMLHRKEKGLYLSVEQLKNRLLAKQFSL